MSKTTLFLGVGSLVLTLTVWFGGPVATVQEAAGRETAARPAAPSEEPALAPVSDASQSALEPSKTYDGSITGTIKLDGKPPRKRILDMSAVAYCAQQHAGQQVFGEDVVLGEGNALANVFVYVKGGPAPKKDAPKEPVVIDQSGCVYKPHVLGVMVGQPILIRNSDDTLHNIHSLPKLNPEFNEGQPKKGMESTKTYSIPELDVKLKCDVHPWMGAWLHVVSNPFYAVTGTDGKFKIEGLPEGEYEIEAIHEKYGKQSGKVKVGKDAATHDFTFKS
ncbi:MAG: hypothetical protein HY716_13275 [Planctomycetes bacterium]|nr:hypothetical protein [Planctomycetota bacterium]